MIEFNMKNARTWSMLGPSGVLGLAMSELAMEDDKLAVITSDLCFFSGLERFKKAYPERLINVGIAEQNMIGVAAGMAKEGMKVFTTTYATFASTRALDQVRVNVGYMDIPIKIIGLTAGFAAGILGATHMSTEDIAIMRSIPNMVVISPADCMETMKAILATGKINKPVYIRMNGIQRAPIVYDKDYDFEIGKANKLKNGSDVSIIATGTAVYQALKATEQLEARGISCDVIDVHTIKPIDTQMIISCCNRRAIVTVEEHSKIGGLGAAVAEVLAPLKNTPPHLFIGVNDVYPHAASYETLLNESGLTAEKIYLNIIEFLKENK